MATKTGKGVLDERAAQLIEEAGKDYPEAWIPESEGESLAGIFVGLDKSRTPFGDSWIVVLDVNGTKRSVWLLHEALRSQFLQARPIEGELVAIVYRGKRKAKNPTPGRSETYHDYRVAVDRGGGTAGEATWETIAGEEPATPSDDEIPY